MQCSKLGSYLGLYLAIAAFRQPQCEHRPNLQISNDAPALGAECQGLENCWGQQQD
jgi:hypothetical protein